MIEINLLPPEYRKAESTPIGRFIAIVAGAVVVTSTLIAYGYVHYSKLAGVRDVRKETEQEFANKQKQADVSKALQQEINAYESRRKAITQVARKRILQSRKLDELLDILQNGGDRVTYNVWLKNLTVKPGRQARRGQETSGGTVSFAGWSESTEFSKVTNLRNALKEDAYFEDFKSISSPNFKEKKWDDGLQPSEAGAFSYSLVLKPLGWRHSGPKGKKK